MLFHIFFKILFSIIMQSHYSFDICNTIPIWKGTFDNLTVCMPANFSCFYCHLQTFFIIHFFKQSFQNTIRVSSSLDPDHDQHSVCPDLGPNCLHRLSADDKSCRFNIAVTIFSSP